MGDEVVCNDPKDGKKVWSVKLKGDLEKSGGSWARRRRPRGPSLFMTTLAGAVLQLDPATGETRKSWEVGKEMRFPPTVEGGRIFVGTQDGRMVCIETGEREEHGLAAVGRERPAHGSGGDAELDVNWTPMSASYEAAYGRDRPRQRGGSQGEL